MLLVLFLIVVPAGRQALLKEAWQEAVGGHAYMCRNDSSYRAMHLMLLNSSMCPVLDLLPLQV